MHTFFHIILYVLWIELIYSCSIYNSSALKTKIITLQYTQCGMNKLYGSYGLCNFDHPLIATVMIMAISKTVLQEVTF